MKRLSGCLGEGQKSIRGKREGLRLGRLNRSWQDLLRRGRPTREDLFQKIQLIPASAQQFPQTEGEPSFPFGGGGQPVQLIPELPCRRRHLGVVRL